MAAGLASLGIDAADFCSAGCHFQLSRHQCLEGKQLQQAFGVWAGCIRLLF